MTPGISQPMTTSSSARAYSRKFQPSEPNSRNHISNSSVGALIHRARPEAANVASMSSGIPTESNVDAPSGQGWTGTYGPPVAQAPPMSMIARMPK